MQHLRISLQNSQMIGKISKGSSFKGCIKYVAGKEKAEFLLASGVFANDVSTIINSFEVQALMLPHIKKPVGHISLSYLPKDEPRLTNEVMKSLAREYMKEMAITNTQYLIVRHHDAQHPHVHIVFNRVDYDAKLISDKNDFRRNELVIKNIKEKYDLSFSQGKQNVKRERLKEPDKTKYQLYDAIKLTMSQSNSLLDFKIKLENNHNITLRLIVKSNTKQVQGIIFQKGQYQFKGSEIDRSLSFSKINAFFEGQRQTPQNSTPSNSNKINNPEPMNNHSPVTDSTNQESIESTLNAALGIFSPETHGPDAQEDEFRRRMQKKKKRGMRI